MKKSHWIPSIVFLVVVAIFLVARKPREVIKVPPAVTVSPPAPPPPPVPSNVAGGGSAVAEPPPAVSTPSPSVPGEATFPGDYPENEPVSATNPVIRYHGMEIVVPGQNIARPMYSRKGWGGEIVFSMSQGKPITYRQIGELVERDGKLVFNQRLAVSFHRAGGLAFVTDRDESASIRRIGIALGGVGGDPPSIEYFDPATGDPLPKPRRTFECTVTLLDEKKMIPSVEIDRLEPEVFPSTWDSFNVTGKPVDFAGRMVRIMWFDRDPATGVIRRMR